MYIHCFNEFAQLRVKEPLSIFFRVSFCIFGCPCLFCSSQIINGNRHLERSNTVFVPNKTRSFAATYVSYRGFNEGTCEENSKRSRPGKNCTKEGGISTSVLIFSFNFKNKLSE